MSSSTTGVRSRIASLEAQSRQSSSVPSSPNSRAASPSTESPATNRSRRNVNNLTSTKKRRSSKTRLQSSEESHGDVTPTSSPWNNNKKTSSSPSSNQVTANRRNDSSTVTSTTVAASENRKSRIRQSQQHMRESSVVSSAGTQQSTNLVEKRKLIKERRLLQKQRKAAVNDEEGNSNDRENKTIARSEAASNDIDSTRAVSPVPDSGINIHKDSPGANTMNSNGSNSASKFSMIQRMTRRKGYENAAKLRGQHAMQRQKSSQQQSSSTASVTGSSATTSVMRNTSTAAAASFRGGGTVNDISSTSRRETPLSDNRQTQYTSNYSHGSSKQEQQPGSPRVTGPDVSLEVPTDDDATLTSVHRIMEQQNGRSYASSSQRGHSPGRNSQPQNSYDSYNSSNGGASSSSWRIYPKGGGNQRQPQLYSNTLSPLRTGAPGSYLNGQRSINGAAYNSRGMANNAFKNSGGWIGEEKSDKAMTASGPRVLRTASSSDYDTDGEISKTSRNSARLIDGPSHSQATTDVNDFFSNPKFAQTNRDKNYNNLNSIHNSYYNHRRVDDDERTFDYGDRDDDSNGSMSYAARRRKEAERRARLEADTRGDRSIQSANEQNKDKTDEKAHEPLLLSKEDMEHYTKSMENPAIRLGAGVVGVATVGCIAFGPVGLLVGVAAVGLGFGVMQIPEEERNKIQAKAEKAVHTLQEKAADASESLSSSCLNTYKDSGVADHLPHCLSGTDEGEQDIESSRTNNVGEGNAKVDASKTVKRTLPPGPTAVTPTSPQVEKTPALPIKQHNDRLRNKKVACLRNVRIIPVSQIYGLDPNVQPRAWLDIVASANTTSQQKNEAMEEILLLAKDKRRARIFLDEGILDSILWTLTLYFDKVDVIGKQTEWAFPDITPSEKTAASLAAQCCVTLGKAHCAAIHTEGDLQLMSMYQRGSVPEERQMAQMLHEVPHHIRVTKTSDPTVVEPSHEVFALRQLTLSQAEELARSIKAVADGRM